MDTRCIEEVRNESVGLDALKNAIVACWLNEYWLVVVADSTLIDRLVPVLCMKRIKIVIHSKNNCPTNSHCIVMQMRPSHEGRILWTLICSWTLWTDTYVYGSMRATNNVQCMRWMFEYGTPIKMVVSEKSDFPSHHLVCLCRQWLVLMLDRHGAKRKEKGGERNAQLHTVPLVEGAPDRNERTRGILRINCIKQFTRETAMRKVYLGRRVWVTSR